MGTLHVLVMKDMQDTVSERDQAAKQSMCKKIRFALPDSETAQSVTDNRGCPLPLGAWLPGGMGGSALSRWWWEAAGQADRYRDSLGGEDPADSITQLPAHPVSDGVSPRAGPNKNYWSQEVV